MVRVGLPPLLTKNAMNGFNIYVNVRINYGFQLVASQTTPDKCTGGAVTCNRAHRHQNKNEKKFSKNVRKGN